MNMKWNRRKFMGVLGAAMLPLGVLFAAPARPKVVRVPEEESAVTPSRWQMHSGVLERGDRWRVDGAIEIISVCGPGVQSGFVPPSVPVGTVVQVLRPDGGVVLRFAVAPRGVIDWCAPPYMSLGILGPVDIVVLGGSARVMVTFKPFEPDTFDPPLKSIFVEKRGNRLIMAR